MVTELSITITKDPDFIKMFGFLIRFSFFFVLIGCSSSPENPKKQAYQQYDGMINHKLPIKMFLNSDPTNWEGYYEHTVNGLPIRLSGHQSKDGQTFSLTEFNRDLKPVGYFDGVMHPDGSLQGTWTDGKKSYPFTARPKNNATFFADTLVYTVEKSMGRQSIIFAQQPGLNTKPLNDFLSQKAYIADVAYTHAGMSNGRQLSFSEVIYNKKPFVTIRYGQLFYDQDYPDNQYELSQDTTFNLQSGQPFTIEDLYNQEAIKVIDSLIKKQASSCEAALNGFTPATLKRIRSRVILTHEGLNFMIPECNFANKSTILIRNVILLPFLKQQKTKNIP